jgi:hypothetical protein
MEKFILLTYTCHLVYLYISNCPEISEIYQHLHQCNYILSHVPVSKI